MNGEEFQIKSPKKLVVFGASKTGKSSFTNYMIGNIYGEKDNTQEDIDDGKK